MAGERKIEIADIDWQAPPPAPSERLIPILSPKPGAPAHVVLLDPAITCLYTHWDDRPERAVASKTRPHVEPSSACEGCAVLKQTPRWKGFAAAWNLLSHRWVIVDITQHALASCKYLHPVQGVDLRGRTLTLTRSGRSGNSPVNALLSQEVIPQDQLPLPFDVRHHLLRVWGLTATSSTWHRSAEGVESLT